MIPHKFSRQRHDRAVSPRLVNQTLDDVRRLAISQPGPGFGGMGTPGGLLTFKNSTDFLLAYADEDGISACKKPSEGSTDQTLGKGLAFPIYVSTDESGAATTSDSTDDDARQPIYNFFRYKVPPGTRLTATKRWNLWVLDPPPSRLYQARTPSAGVSAATGSAQPYEPKKFTSDVWTLGGDPELIAEDADIWNNAPASLTGSRMVYVAFEPDGSFSVFNQVC